MNATDVSSLSASLPSDAAHHPRSLAGGVLPGVAASCAVAAAAAGLQVAEGRLFGHVWLEALVLAIVVGAAVRTAWTPGELWRPGIAWSAKLLLEVAVVLLGAAVSTASLLAVGPALLAGVVGVVAASLVLSSGAGRLLGLTPRMTLLIACGTSICGNSAIAAVAPLIGADGDEVTASIAFTAILGVAVVLGLPVLGVALHMSGLQFGALAGLTVYAVPQVIAAAAPMGLAAVQFGTLVKLVRVLMLGPVCVLLSLTGDRWGVGVTESALSASRTTRLSGFAPWFIVGFLGMIALRSFHLFPAALVLPTTAAAAALTVIAMAALGLSTDLRLVAKSGARGSLAVCLSTLALGAVSLALVRALHLP